MSLRDEIADYFRYLGYSDDEDIEGLRPLNIADAIISLPEMKEMRALWERHQRINELKKAWPTDDKYFAEQIQEWKEKAEALDNLEYGYPQEVEQALKKVREEK